MLSLTFVTQCTLYWNVTQSLSMFLHTPQLVINLLITLHSFLTFFCNKACNPDGKGNSNGNCNGNGNGNGNLLIQINSLL